MRLLIVEDEPTLAELLRRNLSVRGFAVDVAHSKASAQSYLDAETYDVILVDRGLGDSDGLDLVRAHRRRDAECAVIFLTARDAPADRIAGLDVGADDYIVKPFDMDELAARVRAVMRRPGRRLSTVLEAGSLRYDATQRRASVDGRPLELSRRELALLELLLRRQGSVVTRDALLRGLYGFDEEVTANALDAAISRLRKRLRQAKAGIEIQSVRGVGCVLEAAESP
jgi:DNA-binding response OmpR family regulator